MNINKIILSVISIIFFLIYSCGRNPEKLLNDAIKTYGEGNKKAKIIIEKNLINVVSKKKILQDKTIINSKVYFKQSLKNVNVFCPEEITINLSGKNSINHSDINSKYLILSTFKDILIYKRTGEYLKTASIVDKKTSIKDIILYNDFIIYFLDNKLYLYNISNENHIPLINNELKIPYKKYYNVKLYLSGNILGVVRGIAGIYLFDIIDLEHKTTIKKNLSISSSKLYLTENSVYYFKGSVGNWVLVKNDIVNRKKYDLIKFSDIIDVEVTKSGIILQDSSGKYLIDYDSTKIKIPFNYTFLKQYKDILLIKYGEFYYFCDTDNLTAWIKSIYEKIPELFMD